MLNINSQFSSGKEKIANGVLKPPALSVSKQDLFSIAMRNIHFRIEIMTSNGKCQFIDLLVI
jgi:hypothetical protein